MFGVAENITKSLGDTIKNLKLEFAPNGEALVGRNVRGAIIQGDSLSPLTFLCMILMTLILEKSRGVMNRETNT